MTQQHGRRGKRRNYDMRLVRPEKPKHLLASEQNEASPSEQLQRANAGK